MAGEWAAHCLPFSLPSETLPRCLLLEPFTAITKDSQRQDVGQAEAAIAWPRATDSVPALCKPVRSSCVVIWSHTRANLHFQRWNETSESHLFFFPPFSSCRKGEIPSHQRQRERYVTISSQRVTRGWYTGSHLISNKAQSVKFLLAHCDISQTELFVFRKVYHDFDIRGRLFRFHKLV